jgi:predicted esterase
MIKKLHFLFILLLVFFPASPYALEQSEEHGKYIMVVEGYDWGPAVSKVIISMGENVSLTNAMEYSVTVERKTDCIELPPEKASGERTVLYAYVSDALGTAQSSGNYVTLVLFVSPELNIGSPFEYTRNEKCRGNNWIDYKLKIINKTNDQMWDTETGRIMPIIEEFDLSGKYVHNETLGMSYASFTPQTGMEKAPLIIWLHGGGEGGSDPTIPLLANRAANYASKEIQAIFEGAYVLVPQCPGAWMHNTEGVMTHGKENDIYNEGLMTLIKDYVTSHPNIDTDRIYVGGCSNGGYMSLKLILLYPDYFAAGFISALAFQSQYITDEQIKRITHVPIWFVHAEDDQTTLPDLTVIPVYKRLIAAGASYVHASYYEHVVDISGFYGGDNYHYHGHWSWIYLHANKCRLDFGGTPVRINGRPVSIMEWMAAKRK